MNLTLPIQAHLPQILKSFQEASRVLVEADPGAGKSTIGPLEILKNKKSLGIEGAIILLQPRRLATKSLAMRLSYLLSQEKSDTVDHSTSGASQKTIGQTIGYQVRGESKISSQTELTVMTQGIFVKKLLSDPELKGVGLVLFDEFHERHIDGDLSLAMLLDTQEFLRPDLKIGILSATLNRKALLGLLNTEDFECRNCFSEGRQYPVEVKHIDIDPLELKKRHVMIEAAVKYSLSAINQIESGHVLCFLPGVGEINQALELCQEKCGDENVVPLALHSQLSLNEQAVVLHDAAPEVRRIIFATNIAESSLTLPGIAAVVDTGLEKVSRWNPIRDTHSLELELCAQDSCIQRRGRAGRVGPGLAYALWPKRVDAWRPKHAEANLMYEDLVEMKFHYLNWGESECLESRFCDIPPRGHWNAATRILSNSGVINSNGQLRDTDATSRYSSVSINPRLLTLIQPIASSNVNGVIQPIQLETENHTNIRWYLAALLDEDKWPNTQDPISLKNLFHDQFQPKEFRNKITQWENHFSRKWKMPVFDEKFVRTILVEGLKSRITWPQGSQNLQYNGVGLQLHPQLPAKPNGFISLSQKGSQLKCFVYQEIDTDDVSELLQAKTQLVFDEKWKAQHKVLLGPIVLSAKPCSLPVGIEFQEALVGLLESTSAIEAKKDKQQAWLHEFWNLFELEEADHNWNERYFWFRMVCDSTVPSSGISISNSPSIDEQLKSWKFENHWRESWRDWLTPYISSIQSFQDLRNLKLRELWGQSLDYETQVAFKNSTPKKWTSPKGNEFKIQYTKELPQVSVRLQEILGITEHPNLGNKPILFELLSPARRPIQTTQDIPGFWSGSYAEVRKEMKGRYPKHNWPEDPTNISE